MCVCLQMCACVHVCTCIFVSVCRYLWFLVSYRVLNYPLGALIEVETLLTVRLDEGEGEGRQGEQSGAARQAREGTTTSAELGTRVSGADICTHLDLNYLNVYVSDDVPIF